MNHPEHFLTYTSPTLHHRPTGKRKNPTKCAKDADSLFFVFVCFVCFISIVAIVKGEIGFFFF